MCGILGYVGKRRSSSVALCLEGLRKLEYRGYDSAGIAGVKNGKLEFRKEKGKIAVLDQLLKSSPLEVDVAIGHTRWATHGKPSQSNAHPHFDENSSVAIVHNGIIENHLEIRKELEEAGVKFYSETDSEVIAQLIAHHYSDDLQKAVIAAMQKLRGAFAIAVLHKDHPDEILAIAKESPLVIAREDEEIFIASDPHAIDLEKMELFFLHEGEGARLARDGLSFFDATGALIEKKGKLFCPKNEKISKGGYEHFMLKEIFEQPLSLTQAIAGRIQGEKVFFEELNFPLDNIENVIILACGSSWHAGLVACNLIEEMARIPAKAVVASEFRYSNPLVDKKSLVVAISQSGETADTLAAVRLAKSRGAKILGICNVPYCTLVREADSTLMLRAGPEISVCSTKAFTAQLAVLTLLTCKLSGKVLHEIDRIPKLADSVLQLNSQIRAIAKKYAKYESFFFLGRQAMFEASLEAALKLKEISYLQASAYPGGEMKHGPIALLDENLPIIALLGNSLTLEKMESNLMEVKARGAPIFALVPEGTKRMEAIADDLLFMPKVIDHLAPILYSIALQLFAYYIALERGAEIDQPRNLAKSVTVE
ncbi:MAG: glutamine--fructose-6-phosphate transaminase (isomerizing) [Candidatus Algichlamydia australiensis]|nr:glutamine--fructose-6-phosphate transaminase (isomerizing) [Chlamydiales bacterium]